jgi:hypothetical protein
VDDPKATTGRPRMGRSFAWIAILALMVGLTAFYQAH